MEPKSYDTNKVFPVQNIFTCKISLEQNLEALERSPAYPIHEATFVPEEILQQLDSH